MSMKIGLAAALSSLLLTGCGDDSSNSSGSDDSKPNIDTPRPTVTGLSAEGKILTQTAPVVVTFSESMNTSTASVGLDRLSSDQMLASWNDAATELTLTPLGHWPGGKSNLTIEATNLNGHRLAEAYTHALNANLTFDPMQSATAEINATVIDGTTTVFLNGPYSNSIINNGALWLTNYGSHQLLKFNSVPDNGITAPDEVITSIHAKTNDDVEILSLDHPQTPFVADGKMLVSNYGGHFVAIYDNLPTADVENTGIVLGHPDRTSCSKTHLRNPEATFVAGGKVFVVDSGNNRVLIWNSMPTQSHAEPDIVLGQNSFDTCAKNDDNQDNEADELTSARTLSQPSGIWSNGEKLAIIDNTNIGRVLLWHTIPDGNFAAADVVLGVENMVEDINLDLEVSAQSLLPYEGIVSNGQQLFVADTGNNRVMIWDTWPTENFQPADQLLGQSDFGKNAENDIDQDGDPDDIGDFPNRALDVLFNPAGLSLHNDTLVVSDVNNNRVLVFKSK